MNMESEIFEIAPGVRNTAWINLKLEPSSSSKNWKTATKWFRKRIDRFLRPAKWLCRTGIYSGFAVMALDCLLIETLQSFRNGRENPEGPVKKSTKTIKQFLRERSSFKIYFTDDEKANKFIDHFRNGILHQGEVKSTGRIKSDKSRDKPKQMIDPDAKSFIVNRDGFTRALSNEVDCYIQELMDETNILLRKNFIRKMNLISRV